jgi:hypothetical protein
LEEIVYEEIPNTGHQLFDLLFRSRRNHFQPFRR